MTEAKKIEPSDESSATIVAENQGIVNFNAETLIAQAITQNVPVESLERLLAMRKELKAEWAKEQFTRAMAKFQSECPTIIKTKEVRTDLGVRAYSYAPIESIVEQVKTPLQANGFSYSTSMRMLENAVEVEVKVTHIDGHSELTPMTVPLGNKTKVMSETQVVAAASTFAKRYAFCNAFGILTGDEDNDAVQNVSSVQAPPLNTDTGSIKPSDAQIKLIASLCEQKGFTKQDILDEGFTKLTGGKGGTASELIDFLINAKSKVMPNGQTDFVEEIDLDSPEVRS